MTLCLFCTSALVRSLMLALAVYHHWSFTLLKSCVCTWSHIFIRFSVFVFLMFLACIIPENKDSPVKTQKAEGSRKSKNSVIFFSPWYLGDLMILEVHDSWSHTLRERSAVNPAWFQVACLQGNDALSLRESSHDWTCNSYGMRKLLAVALTRSL